MITSSAEQHIFEINAEGDITWEITSASMDYINKASKYSTDYFTDVSISEDFVIRPEKFRLIQNSPNPFNPVTTLRYDLPEQSTVNIIIYDMLGRQVRTLLNQTQDAGFKSVIWDATNDYGKPVSVGRSEEHTSELQSQAYLVCRLLLEKKNKVRKNTTQQ